MARKATRKRPVRPARPSRIEAFNLRVGRYLAGKYEVEGLLGAGWEGEVYKVVERRTGITCAAKLFFPHRNERDRSVKMYARKLDRLRDCSLVIRYHSSEALWHRGQRVSCLISEFVEGELLSDLIESQPGGRLTPFEALHLIHALTAGLEQIHLAREYHGDIHPENVMVRRRGIAFDLKLVDFFHHSLPKADMFREDIVSVIHLLHTAVGGRDRYAKAPRVIKGICRGLRRDLIARKFPTAGHLRRHLESFPWR
jgi:tRNA A-37 threonylcarbamoyl transferase component Bud32